MREVEGRKEEKIENREEEEEKKERTKNNWEKRKGEEEINGEDRRCLFLSYNSREIG